MNPTDHQAKQAYHKPQLFLYGDIQSITQAVGMMGKSDGGSMGQMKTS